MRRIILVAALAMSAASGALAQTSIPRDAPPPDVGEIPRAASPTGATYIPGVGFRFVPPLGPRVYGWYYGPRVYSWSDDRESRRYRHAYRARRIVCDRDSTWYGDRCVRRFR